VEIRRSNSHTVSKYVHRYSVQSKKKTCTTTNNIISKTVFAFGKYLKFLSSYPCSITFCLLKNLGNVKSLIYLFLLIFSLQNDRLVEKRSKEFGFKCDSI
jgi:hypothetical protein